MSYFTCVLSVTAVSTSVHLPMTEMRKKRRKRLRSKASYGSSEMSTCSFNPLRCGQIYCDYSAEQHVHVV